MKNQNEVKKTLGILEEQKLKRLVAKIMYAEDWVDQMNAKMDAFDLIDSQRTYLGDERADEMKGKIQDLYEAKKNI